MKGRTSVYDCARVFSREWPAEKIYPYNVHFRTFFGESEVGAVSARDGSARWQRRKSYGNIMHQYARTHAHVRAVFVEQGFVETKRTARSVMSCAENERTWRRTFLFNVAPLRHRHRATRIRYVEATAMVSNRNRRVAAVTSSKYPRRRAFGS